MPSLTPTRRTLILAFLVALLTLTVSFAGWRAQAGRGHGAPGGGKPAAAAATKAATMALGLGDPLLCLNAGGLVGSTATVTNNNAGPVNAVFTATLPTTLNGLPGTGLASLNQAGINVTNSAVTWTGTIPANTTVILTYKAQIAAGTPANLPICVDSEVIFNGGPRGTVRFNIGAGVGVLMTPCTTTWKGIRTLHKTGLTTSTLTIPVVVPVC